MSEPEDPEIHLARLDGSQMFVRATDPEAVMRSIELYVQQHGCEGMYEAVDDRIETLEDRRSERAFAIAPPRDGWVTVWEDGVLADRRLASFLSGRLRTSVRWLMVSSTTDSWASFSYEDGQQQDAVFQEDVDAISSAEMFASRAGLPHALYFMNDPNLGAYMEQLDIPAFRGLNLDYRSLSSESEEPEPEGLIRRSLPCARSTEGR